MTGVMQVRRRTLQRALEIAGGRSVLCARLATASPTLDAYLRGRQAIPDDVFEIAAEIILDDDVARMMEDRRSEPRTLQIMPVSG